MRLLPAVFLTPTGLAALIETPFNHNPRISWPTSGSLYVRLAGLSAHMPTGRLEDPEPAGRRSPPASRQDSAHLLLGAAKGNVLRPDRDSDLSQPHWAHSWAPESWPENPPLLSHSKCFPNAYSTPGSTPAAGPLGCLPLSLTPAGP